MTTNDRRSKTEATAELVNTPTGRQVAYGRVQILDRDVFGRLTEHTLALLTQYGVDAMERFATAWEQENGSLHIIIAAAGAPATHLMVEKGKWRELDQATYDAFAREWEVRMQAGDADKLLESIADAISAQVHRNSIREAGFYACDAAVMVLDRSMDGLSLAGKVAQDVPSLQLELDAWLEGQEPFALVHMDASGEHRTLTSIKSIADLDERGFAAIQEIRGDLSTCIIVSSVTGETAQQVAEAWERRGGNTADGLAEQVAATGMGAFAGGMVEAEVEAALALAMAYPGAKGLFEIKRPWIEAGDLAPLEDLFAQLEASPEAAEFFSGSIVITVDGYNEDPRMLCEIPEVRDYARSLLEKYPSWFYFMYRQSVEFNLWIGVLTEAKVLHQVNANLAKFRYDAQRVLDLHNQVSAGICFMFLKMGWMRGDPRADKAAAEIGDIFVALVKDSQRPQ